ncbi:hypothetical protein GCM10010171_32490 [Actinokineospora fastidiosa]|uniref:Uncharacterized protein n=1 Tax=Actinokineospora fastidiosa TaxID=1816 RepID=A0A918LDP3_9PSEU|nr:hypothetical protein GCM10010171_32490 [Actinokineospora fastidiosa]
MGADRPPISAPEALSRYDKTLGKSAPTVTVNSADRRTSPGSPTAAGAASTPPAATATTTPGTTPLTQPLTMMLPPGTRRDLPITSAAGA